MKPFKKNYIAIFLGFILLAPILGNNKTAVCKGDSEEIERVVVGKFADTEPVTTITKIYIAASQKSFVESTGRTVYEENSSQSIERSLIPFVRYYYYADPNGLGRITSIHTLYNDYASLKIMLNFLEEKADSLNYSIQEKNNAILGYIRCINVNYYGLDFNLEAATNLLNIQNYDDYKYSLVCGNLNTTFVSAVNNDFSHGMRPFEFFAQFLDPSLFNSNIYGEISGSYAVSNVVSFIDPFSSAREMDIIHLFASIDGMYEHTGVSIILTSCISITSIHAIMGAVGDLEQACNVINNLYANYTDMDDVLDSGAFPYSDLLADADATNICWEFLNGNTHTIASALTNYYEATSASLLFSDRFVDYQSNFLAEYSENRSQSSFETILYYLLGIELNQEGNPINCADFQQEDHNASRFFVLNEDVSPECRYTLATLFSDYIFSF